AEALAFEGEHLVVAGQPGRSDQVGSRAGLLVLDVARVGDLPAAFGVERRLLELRLEPPVAEILVGDDRRQHVRLLVADELAAGNTRGDFDLYLHVGFTRDGPRSFALLLHPRAEAVLIYGDPTLAGQFLGQLD